MTAVWFAGTLTAISMATTSNVCPVQVNNAEEYASPTMHALILPIRMEPVASKKIMEALLKFIVRAQFAVSGRSASML